MRWGDYIVLINFSLNVLCAILYGMQSFWFMVMYFLGAAFINLSIVLMWIYK